MVTISDWCRLVNEAKIDETRGVHKWICCEGTKQRFQVLSEQEIVNSSEKVTKLSLSKIVSISNQLVDKKSVSPVEINPFFALFHPISGFKKNYQLALIRKVSGVVAEEMTPTKLVSYKGEELLTSILNKMEPIEKESSQLQQIFQNVLKMAQRGEEKRKKKNGNFWQRSVTYIVSLFRAPSIKQLKHRLDVELGRPKVARDMAATSVQTYAFQFFKGAGANFTLQEFVSSFVEKNTSLLIWCLSNNLAELAAPASLFQDTWNKLKTTPLKN